MKSIALLAFLLFSVTSWGQTGDFKMRGLCKDIFGLMPAQNIRTAPPVPAKSLTDSLIVASIVQLKNMSYNVDRDFLAKTSTPKVIAMVLKESRGLGTDGRQLVDTVERTFRKTWRQFLHQAQRRSAQKYLHILMALDRYERIENDIKIATDWSSNVTASPSELVKMELALERFREGLSPTEKILFDQTANYYSSFNRWHLPELQNYIHFRTGSFGGNLLIGLFEKMRNDPKVTELMIRFVPDRADPITYYFVNTNAIQRK